VATERRQIIRLLSSICVLWPLLAESQERARPVIGFLNSASARAWAPFVAAFERGLNSSGYTNGENLTIEFRWAEGHNERLPMLASELIASGVAVLVVSGGTPPVLAARAATTATPILFMTGDDPVEVGFVNTLDRPGRNMTGVTIFRVALGAEPVTLLRELVGNKGPMGVLVSPINPGSETHAKNIEQAARAIRQELVVVRASAADELDGAFADLSRQGIASLIVTASPFFISQRDRLVALAARHALPAIYPVRGFVDAGGLISYGADLVDAYRELGLQTARILQGANPAELPVVQSAKFELAVNRKTANVLGLDPSPALLARATAVIE